MQCFAVVRTPSDHVLTPDAAGPPQTALGPADIQDAYKLPIDQGVGQTVATVIWGDDAKAEADLAVFRSQYGLPSCTTDNGCFTKVNQNGERGNYPPDQGAGVETSLDLDAISAACPLCHILLVEADNNTFDSTGPAVDEAVALGAKFVSNSYGAGDYGDPGGIDTHYDHPGVAIVASAGDNANLVDYPSAIPTVTAAGGTLLTRDTGTSRGWDESVWGHSEPPGPRDGTGSGCSSVEPKPDYQNGVNTGCDMRATADISADADPASGLAIYDSNDGQGWLQVGGTSLSSPLLAGMYALAGTPTAGTHPVTYSYDAAAQTHLFDITQGVNSNCGTVLCTAGPGWDGPTGWGTPNGVQALTSPGPHGDIAGKVTDAATGKPIAGATVTVAGSFSVTTDSSGKYTLTVDVGSYALTVRAFGYADKSASGVQVSDGQTTTEDFALAPAAKVTLSGTITDGSGQDWPLFAKISINGDPNGTVSTDPFTGKYSISVPGQASYTMTVTPLYPGYATKTVTVTVGTTGAQQDVAVPVDTTRCEAPGYTASAGTCLPVSGGLVAGVVTDANTGKPANNVQVADADGQAGTSGSNADPDIPDGFYWLFASPPGAVMFTASGASYQPAWASVTVAKGAVTRQDWALKAGQVTITPGKVSTSLTLGKSASQKVTLTNSGTQPVHVDLGTDAGGFTQAGSATQSSRTPVVAGKSQGWQEIARYPLALNDGHNAAAYDPQTGKVYSVGGLLLAANFPLTAKGYAYDPANDSWDAIAPAPRALQDAMAAFIGGTLYLAGGYVAHGGSDAPPSAAVYAYTPGSNTWAKVAALPQGLGQSAVAVLGGRMYLVGGCVDQAREFGCDEVSHASDAVYRYDPASNTWTTLANYPVAVDGAACAGVDGQVVCTGGQRGNQHYISATYLYDPVTNTWSQGASIPSADEGIWRMSYAGANGRLQIADGVSEGGQAAAFLQEAREYNPVSNTWTTLPTPLVGDNSLGGACGFYMIGSGDFASDGTVLPGSEAEVLPGYDHCDGAGDSSWLSVNSTKVTVPAGKSVTLTVGLNTAKLTQPGTYTASLWAATDTPYPVQSIPVSLHVKPPAGWQKITGTVTGSGSPVVGATVAFSRPGGGAMVPTNRPAAVGAASPAARTDGAGHYTWWLPAGRVQVSAAKDGFQASATTITLNTNSPATVNFTLKPATATSPFGPAATHTTATAKGKVPTSGSAATSKAATALQKLDATAPVCGAPKPGYAACLSLLRTGLPQHKGLFPAADAPPGYGPSDLQSAYNLPLATAGERTVAIVDAGDDPTAEADLATYRTQYGLPPCTTANGCFKKVNQNGEQGNYPPDQGWGTEIALDIDMVSAVCPTCHILLVEGNDAGFDNMGTAVDTAVRLGAKYVSNSYGVPATGGEFDGTAFDHYYDHPGVAVTVSSGDSGYGVEWPASSPAVTSVGGTSLTRDASSTRGWAETAWAGAGSGCSQYETAKPEWQRDTGCAHRTVADVSAVADPATGVAIYSPSGWGVVGGTSVSSPIIAAVYALAGQPEAGTNAASYPYLSSTGLNDITAGSNGSCTPAYLCAGGDGYDGPTGLGTPNGVSAFTPVDAGTLAGTITDAATGKPIPAAAVTAGSLPAATTDSSGQYSLVVPPGTYTVTATRFGYAASTATGVQVTEGQTTTQDFTLAAAANETVSGTVTDGSGHGWPLYAKITVGGVSGVPAQAFYTSPDTGDYQIQLPGQNTYTLTVTPVYPGYQTTTATVEVGTAEVRHDIGVPVVAASCSAPGYQFGGGASADFTGWTETTTQGGWTDVDINSHSDWNFGDPAAGGAAGLNLTGGSGGFAVASPVASPTQADQDTNLISPVFSLAGENSPEIAFDTALISVQGGTLNASVDLSLDGGTTWQNAWQQTSGSSDTLTDIDDSVSVPIPQAAGQANVQVRFHYAGSGASLWQLDNIQVGTPGCQPAPGGLVAGVVTDANTGQPVNGATVTSNTDTGATATSAATGDTANPGGFYWLFSPHTGATGFTATDSPYVASKATVSVTADAVTRQDWALQAGQLTASPSSLSATATLGTSKTFNVTLRNTGGAPVDVGFGAQAGGFAALNQAATGRPDGPRQAPGPVRIDNAGVSASASASTSAWAGITDFPTPIVNNAVATDPQTGQVYSVGGENTRGGGLPGQPIQNCHVTGGPIADADVYDPSANAWSPIAPLPQPLESPSAAFVNGTLYVVGGFDCNLNPSSAVYAYAPGASSWTQVANVPTAVAAPGIAVLNGQLYVVGGCEIWYCAVGLESQSVYRYDPSHDTWTQLADYPVAHGVSFEACAGVDGEIACAGGLGTGGAGGDAILNSTYQYNPASNTWTQGADMPYSAFQMSSSGSGGELQVVGGVVSDSGDFELSATDQAAQYDPASNSWSALPSLPTPEWGGGGACGMYVVGGSDSTNGNTSTARVLPGHDQCDGAGDTGWLPTPKGISLQPGKSVTFKVSLDAAQVNQPGTYTANLYATGNTPYANTVIPVTFQVTPPSSWGLLSGTVTAADGDPIAGATAQLCSNYRANRGDCGPAAWTLKTDASGRYQLWLDVRYSPVQVIAAKDGYVQQVGAVRVRPGRATAADFALQRFEPGQHALRDRPHARSHPAGAEAMPRQRPGLWPG